ncbi:SMAD/FHA domain-containing protein [Chaetomium sp. MPI-SDFR-AT-0129]|nr:SMAD/FHA domain-containing protein [Chaetomium sp. MPI-SDFR-AT-0129]
MWPDLILRACLNLNYTPRTTQNTIIANIVPNAVWAIITDAGATGLKKYKAFERYLYAVEVEIKKAEETLEYKEDIDRDAGRYKDPRNNSRKKSQVKTDKAKTKLRELRQDLDVWSAAWKEEAKKAKVLEKFKFALSLDSQYRLEHLGTQASDLNKQLDLRISRRDEKDKRRREQEEWNWKQEQRRKEEPVPPAPLLEAGSPAPSPAAETAFNHGQLQILLAPLNNSFTPPRLIVLPSWPGNVTIGRRLPEDRTTPLTASDSRFDHPTVSRRHAEIWRGAGATVWVRDLGSSMGTFVNQIRLSLSKEESTIPRELRVGDVIQFGDDLYDEETGEIVEQPAIEARLEQIRLVNGAV